LSERYKTGRTAKASFDSQFIQGRCPIRFYQIGDECVFFPIDGKIYSWNECERICSRRVARMLESFSSSNPDQPNMKPSRGVRQLILNTPEKTQMFHALYQSYDEQNFAVRLPDDYNLLRRCYDNQNDQWPHYCTSNIRFNATCFETTSPSSLDICLREVDCEQRYLRLACEFTLPGSGVHIEFNDRC
jgi:hypothetical protein